MGVRLFREATQLETETAIERVAGRERIHTEIQVHAPDVVDPRRPTVTAFADTIQRPAARTAITRIAEARGGLGR